ncbi:MAG: hypothetical protein ACI9Y1_001871 [Lentisphaeria bacterium]|jgi:hypothetical protein
MLPQARTHYGAASAQIVEFHELRANHHWPSDEPRHFKIQSAGLKKVSSTAFFEESNAMECYSRTALQRLARTINLLV